jgi:hypothetical protein
MVDLGLLKTDPDKLYPVIYYALKRTLKEWEEAMNERPGVFISLSLSLLSVNSPCLMQKQRTSSGHIRVNWLLQRKYSLLNI